MKQRFSPDTQRMIFGVYLMTLLFVLGMGIAFGKVEEKTSFGLQAILTSFEVIAGAWAGYTFGKRDEATKQVIQQMMEEFEAKRAEMEAAKVEDQTKAAA